MKPELTPEQWVRVQCVFEGALALPIEQRDAHVVGQLPDDAALAAEVRRLLAAHDARGPLDWLAADLAGKGESAVVPDEPLQLGVWRLGTLIGRGGMGSVHLAERADGQYAQRAAIKLLRRDVADPELRRRFLVERGILARIEHPGIARILDGGVTEEGRPWFALEYVEGKPIDVWCQERRLNVRERLQLFRAVCAAVQYSHAHLIVHRDIKPANILVTSEGAPKLLDFGIARLLDPELLPAAGGATHTGTLLLTPEFASPEQQRGKAVGTASDVFQLGILLFVLLTGRVPRRAAGTAAQTLPVAERPSAVAPEPLRRGIDRDLDTIVAAATRPEPDRRYASADQLADDVQRWLNHLPIRARPDTFLYRTGRFVRRNRAGVGLATALATSLIAFSTLTTVQARRVERERDRAREVTAFLTELFQFPNPRVSGTASVTARDVVDRGAARIRTGISDPLLRADLLAVLATTYQGLGFYEQALEFEREALEILRSRPHTEIAIAHSHRRMAVLQADAGRADSAVHHGTESIRLFRRHAPRGTALALALVEYGSILRTLGHAAAAEPYLEEAIAIYERDPRADPVRFTQALASYGFSLRSRGDVDRAEAFIRRARELSVEFGAPGDASQLRDDPARAERAWAQAADDSRTTRGADHPATASLEVNHALALQRLGRVAEADALLQRAIATMQLAWPDGDARLARALVHHGRLLLDAGRHDEAEPVLRRALAMLTERTPHDSPDLVHVRIALGGSLAAQQRFGEAEPHLLAAHDILGARGARDPDTREHVARLIAFYDAWGRSVDAARFRALLQDPVRD